GVVYKARQTTLKRLVALKMILGGGFASADHRARFLVEGEMLARLHHPNIVAVYEVGYHEGNPFLALEYVEGRTLHDRLHQAPLAPRAAAALVEQLARATHHAHLQGVIHRDLKPANVLLQMTNDEGRMTKEEPAGRSSFVIRHSSLGIPKITDFG